MASDFAHVVFGVMQGWSRCYSERACRWYIQDNAGSWVKDKQCLSAAALHMLTLRC